MIALKKPTISKYDIIQVFKCLLSDEIAEGNLTRQFEKQLAKYLGTIDSIAVNHVSHALFLIFSHIGLAADDEVIVSALAEPVILEVLQLFQARFVLVDVQKDNFLLDDNALIDSINSRTRVIIASHSLGYGIDVAPLKQKIYSVSREKGFKQSIVLVEDCMHSLGSRYLNSSLGLVGDYGVFSFSAHNIITLGQGAAVISRDKKNLNRLRQLKKGDTTQLRGRLDFSLTDLQAAMGLSELSLIDKFLVRRREIGTYYEKNLLHSRNHFYPMAKNFFYNYYSFVLRVETSLPVCLEFFKKHRIEVHKTFLNKALYYLEEAKGEKKIPIKWDQLMEMFPRAGAFELKCLSIPIYPTLKKDDMKLIGRTLSHL